MEGTVQAAQLFLSLGGIRLPIGLTLNQVELVAHDISATIPFQTVEHPLPAQLKVTITKESLADYLAGQMPPQFRNLEVEISADTLVLIGQVNFVVNIPARVVVQLVISKGKELHVALVEVEPALARPIVESQLQNQNPVLRAEDLPVEVQFSTVEYQVGQSVTVTAEARLGKVSGVSS